MCRTRFGRNRSKNNVGPSAGHAPWQDLAHVRWIDVADQQLPARSLVVLRGGVISGVHMLEADAVPPWLILAARSWHSWPAALAHLHPDVGADDHLPPSTTDRWPNRLPDSWPDRWPDRCPWPAAGPAGSTGGKRTEATGTGAASNNGSPTKAVVCCAPGEVGGSGLALARTGPFWP